MPQMLFSATPAVDELKKQIDERAATIKKLEQEISQYQKNIDDTSKQASSLNSTIKVLDSSQKQIETSITVTSTKIDKTNLTLQQLAEEILDKEERMNTNKKAVAEVMRHLQSTDTDSIMEMFLRNNSLSSAWDDVATSETFQNTLHANTVTLATLKTDLQKDYASRSDQKKQLVDLQKELADKKVVVESSKKEKAQLLSDTKNKEADYKKILAEKVAAKAAFEKELKNFESQLNFVIDPKSIPSVGSGVLTWPLDEIVITQEFGDTAFSRTTNAYNGNGHNGIDFKASIGTRIKSAAGGVVKGTGDTDVVCPRASYGKWVLVEHTNGLSTLYAHLSVISVTNGQSVKAGDILGYSGNTGYSTGPHLHFTVYATQGVRILSRQSQVCGGTYVMPVADLKAYLNPLLYL
jgi:murein DD-endopeptidase MepM/ murein hydrolase activator NlpD